MLLIGLYPPVLGYGSVAREERLKSRIESVLIGNHILNGEQ